MPIYEFECPIHGRFERIFPLSLYEEIKESVMCDISISEFGKGIVKEDLYCGEAAVKIASIPSPPYLAKPTRIFVNQRTGERQVATSHYGKPPAGFTEQELRGTRERTRFEIEETHRANAAAQIETQIIKDKSNALRKARQDDMIATMHSKQIDIHPDTGEKIEYHIDHNTEQLLKKAMKRSVEKDRIPTKVVERKLTVNHMDSSNLVDAPK